MGIISQSMSNWARPVLVVPKKEECVDTSNNAGSSKNGNFNLWLCINYRKLNSWIQTTCQIKANGSLGEVISNYPLPTIDHTLVHFNGCKFFSTIDLCSGYYHIKLTKEVDEKTVFVTDKASGFSFAALQNHHWSFCFLLCFRGRSLHSALSLPSTTWTT